MNYDTMVLEFGPRKMSRIVKPVGVGLDIEWRYNPDAPEYGGFAYQCRLMCEGCEVASAEVDFALQGIENDYYWTPHAECNALLVEKVELSLIAQWQSLSDEQRAEAVRIPTDEEYSVMFDNLICEGMAQKNADARKRWLDRRGY